MPSTRILIAQLPAMLRDIVLDTVAPEPDMEVVGILERGESILPAVDRTGATVVILDAHAPLPRDESGAPAVVVLTSDGREAFLRVTLGELSRRRLVQTLRGLPALLHDADA